MDAHNFDPLVLEFELVSLRRDLQRILSKCGDGKKKENYWQRKCSLNHW
jgi:hypothetical protein